jgi:predicted nucleic acid-binding protein
MAFVLDASATLPWCFRDEATLLTENLLARARSREMILVPSHWQTEVLNGLLQAQRRGRIQASDVDGFLFNLEGLYIECESRPFAAHLSAVRVLAERHTLTAYDAAYLELAKRMGHPLATLDQQLVSAARAENVSLLL